jgi:alcohol dehydrogenase
MSQAFSREAWRHLAPNFRRVLEDPEDPEARAAMQLGACFAGLAIENSMLGAAHALANPLSAAYGVVHGQAVGVMLPHVIRFNGEQFADLYRQLLEVTSGIPGLPTVEQGVEGLAEFITDLLSETGLAGRLNDLQVPETDLPQLAENAAQQWTGTFNPRSVSSGEWLALYQAAF